MGRETFLANPLAASTAPVFSPDGRLMAVNSLDGEVVLWDRATGQKHLTAEGAAIAFAPDSRSLAMTGSDGGTLEVIDTETGSELWKTRTRLGPRDEALPFRRTGRRSSRTRAGCSGSLRPHRDASGWAAPRLTREV